MFVDKVVLKECNLLWGGGGGVGKKMVFCKEITPKKEIKRKLEVRGAVKWMKHDEVSPFRWQQCCGPKIVKALFCYLSTCTPDTSSFEDNVSQSSGLQLKLLSCKVQNFYSIPNNMNNI